MSDEWTPTAKELDDMLDDARAASGAGKVAVLLGVDVVIRIVPLLEIYSAQLLTTESITLADEILAANLNDADALSSKRCYRNSTAQTARSSTWAKTIPASRASAAFSANTISMSSPSSGTCSSGTCPWLAPGPARITRTSSAPPGAKPAFDLCQWIAPDVGVIALGAGNRGIGTLPGRLKIVDEPGDFAIGALVVSSALHPEGHAMGHGPARGDELIICGRTAALDLSIPSDTQARFGYEHDGYWHYHLHRGKERCGNPRFHRWD